MSAFMSISSLKPALRLPASEMSRPSVSRSCSVRVTVLFLPALFFFVVVMVILFGISLGRCPAPASSQSGFSDFFVLPCPCGASAAFLCSAPFPVPLLSLFPLPRSIQMSCTLCSFLCSAASLCSDVLHSLLFLHPLLCLRCKSVELIYSSHG